MGYVHGQLEGDGAAQSDLHSTVLEVSRKLKVIVGDAYTLRSARCVNNIWKTLTFNQVDPRRSIATFLVFGAVLLATLPGEPEGTVRTAPANDSEGVVYMLSPRVIG